jgi:hypothetical protein
MAGRVLSAPLGRVFVSVEGETSRVGEVTGFVELGNAPHATTAAALARLGSLPVYDRVVVDSCEVAYLDWVPWVAELLRVLPPAPLPPVLETRGERVMARVGGQRVYLHLTPGFTAPDFIASMREGDEVKVLVHDPADVAPALDALRPYALAGLPCFLFPRLQPGPALCECFREFLRLPASPARMMLVEHEIVGID